MRLRTKISARRVALRLSAATVALAVLCSMPTQIFAGVTLPRTLNLLDGADAGQLGALTILWLLAASTLVSEDLTCVAAGVLAAQGRISFALAASGCLLGIYVGDLLLFLAGRFLGRSALALAPLRWVVKPADVERSSEWFERRGAAVILLSRFLPGTRLATYFAAGVLDTSLLKFALYFFIAAAVWTPMLVGLSALLGAEALKSSLAAGQGVLVKVLLSAGLVFIFVKLLLRLTNYKGRRLLVSRWRRIRRWEFWPPWVFYPPVVAYVLWLGLKHRSLTLFTCANPAIPGGGTVGESKMEILRGLSASAASQKYVARAGLLSARADAATRVGESRAFMAAHGLTLPIVLKPDAGQRGSGVAVVRSDAQLGEYLSRARGDTIIQEYAPGFEFGVFYCRFPEEERGRIFSVTEKRFPVVVGDGVSMLETLILKDERAVCMARAYFRLHRERLDDVPREGERVRLVELGTHCRGAVFLDGAWVKTVELENVIDELCRGFKGFYFGRFDIRVPSVEDFRKGSGFKVVELNGVTSEATHIYDPQGGLLDAYRTLFEQWRIAFRIGAQNRARGARPTTIWTLARLAFENFFGEGETDTLGPNKPHGNIKRSARI
ncbi:MAG TPA: VTT domain-containing protein [Pyrinomonadaceae bacterium]|nr:VTT domain-containing protein [Pyrinomonadaceae bacterium]